MKVGKLGGLTCIWPAFLQKFCGLRCMSAPKVSEVAVCDMLCQPEAIDCVY